MENIYIQTHGCSANLSESEAMMGLLIKAGFSTVNNIKQSDVNVINIWIMDKFCKNKSN